MYLADLIINDKEGIALADLILPDADREQLHDLLKEYSYAEELARYDLPVNNKLLLHGSSGCGKTATAKAIARALDKPLMILNLSNVINAKLGVTAQNLNMVFGHAARMKAVLVLDEFDQISKERNGDEKDVGEMHRIVNALIQLFDQLSTDVLLICATNHRKFIDQALLRRFQLQLSYSLPSASVLDTFYEQLLLRYPDNINSVDRRYEISFAEAKDYALTAVKKNLIRSLEYEVV